MQLLLWHYDLDTCSFPAPCPCICGIATALITSLSVYRSLHLGILRLVYSSNDNPADGNQPAPVTSQQ
jgi:hypothetical protein